MNDHAMHSVEHQFTREEEEDLRKAQKLLHIKLIVQKDLKKTEAGIKKIIFDRRKKMSQELQRTKEEIEREKLRCSSNPYMNRRKDKMQHRNDSKLYSIAFRYPRQVSKSTNQIELCLEDLKWSKQLDKIGTQFRRKTVNS